MTATDCIDNDNEDTFSGLKLQKETYMRRRWKKREKIRNRKTISSHRGSRHVQSNGCNKLGLLYLHQSTWKIRSQTPPKSQDLWRLLCWLTSGHSGADVWFLTLLRHLAERWWRCGTDMGEQRDISPETSHNCWRSKWSVLCRCWMRATKYGKIHENDLTLFDI